MPYEVWFTCMSVGVRLPTWWVGSPSGVGTVQGVPMTTAITPVFRGINMINSIDSFIVYDYNYRIDHEESIRRFSDHLVKHEAKSNREAESIGYALHNLFDKHLGMRLASPYVVAECLRELNAQPDNYTELTLSVQSFLKHSSVFEVQKGKGGGWARTADLRR